MYRIPSNNLIWLDTIVIGAAAQDFTFSSSGNGVNLYPVNGDVDGSYVIHGRVTHDFNASEISFRPNGTTTNQSTQAVNGAGVGFSRTTLHIFGGALLFDQLAFRLFFNARTGFARNHVCRNSGVDLAATTPGWSVCGGVWNESVTNVTSLVIHSSAVNMTAGTFELFRVRQ